MLRRIQLWKRRNDQLREERAQLSQVPPMTLDLRNLRTLTKREINQVFLSRSIDDEWPELSTEIGRIVVIEDMKTPGVNPGDRRALYYLLRALRPRSVLEIGTNVGASTIHIAAAMKRNYWETKAECRLVTVDRVDVNHAPDACWKQADLPRSPAENVAQFGVGDRIEFVVMDSLSYFDTHADQFDFIFLDGDHAASTVYQELPRALKHLRADGAILLHDVFPGHRPLWHNGALIPGPLLAVERYKTEGANVELLPLGALPWPTKLESNVTSLALLTR